MGALFHWDAGALHEQTKHKNAAQKGRGNFSRRHPPYVIDGKEGTVMPEVILTTVCVSIDKTVPYWIQPQFTVDGIRVRHPGTGASAGSLVVGWKPGFPVRFSVCGAVNDSQSMLGMLWAGIQPQVQSSGGLEGESSELRVGLGPRS